MQVGEIMRKSLLWVEENTPVKNITRIIFTTNIYGLSVVKSKKLVGFVTEEDIFFQMNDEKKALTVWEKPVKNVMVRNVISVAPETDIIEAQMLMYKHNFAQLPVINSSGELVGAVTRVDIFKHVLEEEFPKMEEDQFASFIANNYDELVDWEKRFDQEFPTLFRIFNRNNVKKVLDLGVWTGEYTIGLAREGINIVGVDNNPLMIKLCNNKRATLSQNIKKRVNFKLSNYKNLLELFPSPSFDAVMCMGGMLPYLPIEPIRLMESAYSVLRKDGIFVLQLLNHERVIKNKKRLHYFKINKSNKPNEVEDLYVEFFDKKDKNTLIQNTLTFSSDGERWIYGGINSINMKYIESRDIELMVTQAGFKNILITGNKAEDDEYGQLSLTKPFDPLLSDWLTVIATK